jgi:hypothetical protein
MKIISTTTLIYLLKNIVVIFISTKGSTNARSSATNFALTNTISTLFEIRGVGIGKTAFKRRVYITYLMALSYMETSFNNIELIKDEIRKATDQQMLLLLPA